MSESDTNDFDPEPENDELEPELPDDDSDLTDQSSSDDDSSPADESDDEDDSDDESDGD